MFKKKEKEAELTKCLDDQFEHERKEREKINTRVTFIEEKLGIIRRDGPRAVDNT